MDQWNAHGLCCFSLSLSWSLGPADNKVSQPAACVVGDFNPPLCCSFLTPTPPAASDVVAAALSVGVPLVPHVRGAGDRDRMRVLRSGVEHDPNRRQAHLSSAEHDVQRQVSFLITALSFVRDAFRCFKGIRIGA